MSTSITAVPFELLIQAGPPTKPPIHAAVMGYALDHSEYDQVSSGKGLNDSSDGARSSVPLMRRQRHSYCVPKTPVVPGAPTMYSSVKNVLPASSEAVVPSTKSFE